MALTGQPRNENPQDITIYPGGRLCSAIHKPWRSVRAERCACFVSLLHRVSVHGATTLKLSPDGKPKPGGGGFVLMYQ